LQITVNDSAKAYINERFYDKGVLYSMSDTIKQSIADKLASLYDEGFTTSDVVDVLASEEPFADVSADWELERIARTEVASAYTMGGLDSARDSELDLIAVFLAGEGACDECKAWADDNPYELDDAEVEDLPHPNCLDSWSYITRSDYEGAGDEEE